MNIYEVEDELHNKEEVEAETEFQAFLKKFSEGKVVIGVKTLRAKQIEGMPIPEP